MSEVESTEFADLVARVDALSAGPDGAVSKDAAVRLDALLTRVARERGAVDVAIGEVLHELLQGDRLIRLGFAGLTDYARERLDIGGSTARAMERLARSLRSRLVLAAAVRSGEVSARKALTVVPVSRGEEAEREWVEKAKRMTVRELEAAVKAARNGFVDEPLPEDEPFVKLEFALSAEQRVYVDRALALAKKVVGHAAPWWVLLEAICQEFLAKHPEEADQDFKGTLFRYPPPDAPDALKEALEKASERWSALERIECVAAPIAEWTSDPFKLDVQLRELALLRQRWDSLVGHLAMLMQTHGLWRELQFASFEHYCTERLQMAESTVRQRVQLERKLEELPTVRRALEEGRISYEKARRIAKHATERTAGKWVERAEQMTCIELQRAIASDREAQMCSKERVEEAAPTSVTALFEAACITIHRVEGRFVEPGECLARMSQHFVEVWEEALEVRNTVQARVAERDKGLCQVPGCSRSAAHVHHVVFRSHLGEDVEENLVSLCAMHHERGIHKGYIHVEGDAPDGLRWELGLRPNLPSLLVFDPSSNGSDQRPGAPRPTRH